MKLQVSNSCYSEIATALKRLGREINDGAIISLEKGDAIVPPQDFRMVAIRQNCLGAATEIFKTIPNPKEGAFLNIAEDIFKWSLSGERLTETDKER